MKITTAAGLAATITAALVLTGCASSDTTAPAAAPPPVPSAATPAPVASAQHNDADIAFVQGMIPHHSQAVQMSQLAPDRAESPQVKQLATRIEQAQGPEIAQMRAFLASWGAPETGAMPGMSGMPGMGQGQMGAMAGMMTDQQMQQLGQTRGAAFDRMFLQMMIQHHEGAVTMARTELANGTNPQAKQLAQQIIDAQQAEITEMRQLLAA